MVSYTYDPWGAPMSVSGSMSATLGAVNPLRYRGYVYDSETGLYYLSSRYYNPVWGRFINADGYASTGQGFTGDNMFAYCNDNPVNYKDSEGTEPELAMGWAASMSWLPAIDGPVPVADTIYILGFVAICLIGAENLNSFPGIIWNQKPEADDPPIVTPQVPPSEDDGYVAPKGGPKKGKAPNGKSGWVDNNGNVWVPAPSGTPSAHGGGHWDVQRGDGKGYTNVYPGGKMRKGSGKSPKIGPKRALR